MASVRNVCVSDSSAREAWRDGLRKETSSTAEEVQQEVTAAAFSVSLWELPAILGVEDASEDTDFSGIQESGILMQFCLFTRMHKNT